MERNFRPIIAIIFLTGLTLRVLWVWLVPLWQQADEYPHFHYIQHLYKYQAFPISKPVFPDYEGYQPPMYYLISAGIYSILPALDQGREKMGADFEVSWKSAAFQSQNQMAMILRWVSVLLWIGTFWISYTFLVKFFGDQENVILLSLSLLAFIPTLVSNTSSITNDSLAIFWSTLFFYLMMSERIHKPNRLFLLGLILGWGILTKYNCVILVPTFIGSVLLFHRHSFWRISLPVLGIATLMVFPWFRFTSETYGQALALNPGFRWHASILNHTLSDYFKAMRNLFWSFWGAAGRAYEIHLPVWYYLAVFGGISLVAGWGLFKLFARIRTSTALTSFQFNLAVLAVTGFLILGVASVWYSLSYQVMSSWGKNLYVFILPINILFALGWNQVSSRRTWAYWLPILLLATNLIYLFGYVLPHFNE